MRPPIGPPLDGESTGANRRSKSGSNVLRASGLSYNHSHAEKDVLDHLYPVRPAGGFHAALLVGVRGNHPHSCGVLVDRLPQRLVLAETESGTRSRIAGHFNKFAQQDVDSARLAKRIRLLLGSRG